MTASITTNQTTTIDLDFKELADVGFDVFGPSTQVVNLLKCEHARAL